MGYVYIACMVLFTTLGQLLTKRGSQDLVIKGNMVSIMKSLVNGYVIAAFLIIMITPVFYILALRELDLSIAFAFTGLNYIFVSLGGKLLFGEQLNKYHYFGMTCIFIGLVIFQS